MKPLHSVSYHRRFFLALTLCHSWVRPLHRPLPSWKLASLVLNSCLGPRLSLGSYDYFHSHFTLAALLSLLVLPLAILPPATSSSRVFSALLNSVSLSQCAHQDLLYFISQSPISEIFVPLWPRFLKVYGGSTLLAYFPVPVGDPNKAGCYPHTCPEWWQFSLPQWFHHCVFFLFWFLKYFRWFLKYFHKSEIADCHHWLFFCPERSYLLHCPKFRSNKVLVFPMGSFGFVLAEDGYYSWCIGMIVTLSSRELWVPICWLILLIWIKEVIVIYFPQVGK